MAQLDDRQSDLASSPRLISVDAYRGGFMFLMMAEVMHLSHVARALPDSGLWQFLALHQSHVPWVGCTLHDLIQPSFSFLVGVVLPFSLARRLSDGQSEMRRTLHALWRAVLLILLGVFLRSVHREQTYWTFEDTLTQIGLGYFFLYLLARRSLRWQWVALAVILFGSWLAFVLYPGLTPEQAGDDNVTRGLTGFAQHWNKNANPAWAFDCWFLNLFPREKVFQANGGGYVTLSFIPTLGTMILGVLAGGVLQSERRSIKKIQWLFIAGLIGLVSGWLLGRLGICPVVKRIWTPSWVLFSGGWCFLLLAAFYLVVDVVGLKRWAFPLVVFGKNSISAYVIAHLFVDFIRAALLCHLGQNLFVGAGEAYQPLILGAAILFIEWLLLWWMYRRRLFLRI